MTEDGTISGWNNTVNATQAIITVNNNGKAIYKGCAIAQANTGQRLYVANFKTGRVEAYTSNFQYIAMNKKAFNINAKGYVPFNIQNLGGNLVVTYAKKRAGATDEITGAGLGRVAVFDPNGRKLLSLQNGAWFNAPWGIALAPSDFGAFSHRLLIGNFGDGKINAFNTVTGRYAGTLIDVNNKPQPLIIDGLWALSFGGGTTRSGAGNELYFTAGPNDEKNGLFGKLVADSADQKGNTE